MYRIVLGHFGYLSQDVWKRNNVWNVTEREGTLFEGHLPWLPGVLPLWSDITVSVGSFHGGVSVGNIHLGWS